MAYQNNNKQYGNTPAVVRTLFYHRNFQSETEFTVNTFNARYYLNIVNTKNKADKVSVFLYGSQMAGLAKVMGAFYTAKMNATLQSESAFSWQMAPEAGGCGISLITDNSTGRHELGISLTNTEKASTKIHWLADRVATYEAVALRGDFWNRYNPADAPYIQLGETIHNLAVYAYDISKERAVNFASINKQNELE